MLIAAVAPVATIAEECVSKFPRNKIPEWYISKTISFKEEYSVSKMLEYLKR